MADTLTPTQRRYCMSRIRNRDTEPELIVRRLVHSLGYRYRLCPPSLPGRPDLVFSGKKKVIFVHGCFWHRHRCRLGSPVPRTRAPYWQSKFERNTRRDAKNRRLLLRAGWHVMTVWQCQLKDLDAVTAKLARFLGI